MFMIINSGMEDDQFNLKYNFKNFELDFAVSRIAGNTLDKI